MENNSKKNNNPRSESAGLRDSSAKHNVFSSMDPRRLVILRDQGVISKLIMGGW